MWQRLFETVGVVEAAALGAVGLANRRPDQRGLAPGPSSAVPATNTPVPRAWKNAAVKMPTSPTAAGPGAAPPTARRANPPTIRTELVFGADAIAVACSGAWPLPLSPGGPVPFLRTTSPLDKPRGAIAPAYVGAAEPGALFLDLAMAPGPIAIAGDPRAGGRLALALARQLCSAIDQGADHTAVATAGAPFGLRPLRSGTALRWPSLAEFHDSWIPETARFCFLFCTLPNTRDAERIQLLMQNQTRRIIPIMVGEQPPATDWLLTALSSRV